MKLLYTTLLSCLIIFSTKIQADSIVCRAVRKNGQTGCQASTSAGIFGTCPSPYVSEYFTAPGYPGGVYCARGCTDEEIADCNQKGCTTYTESCSSTTQRSCELAVEYCKGIVSDYVCQNAPKIYTKCEYTNKCQSVLKPCCPPEEDLKSFDVASLGLVIGPNGKLSKRLFSLCGLTDQVLAATLDAQYRARGGVFDLSRLSTVPICRRTKNAFKSINGTRVKSEEVEAIIAENKLQCENAGGTFNSTTGG